MPQSCEMAHQKSASLSRENREAGGALANKEKRLQKNKKKKKEGNKQLCQIPQSSFGSVLSYSRDFKPSEHAPASRQHNFSVLHAGTTPGLKLTMQGGTPASYNIGGSIFYNAHPNATGQQDQRTKTASIHWEIQQPDNHASQLESAILRATL